MLTGTPRSALPGPTRVTRAGVALTAVLALLFAYYAWTATSSGNPFNKPTPFFFKHDGKDYYNLQAEAYLKGHLWVDVPVPPEILALDDPYASAGNLPVFPLVDAALYHDRYWLPWGPAPAVTTFLPPRLVGAQIRENLAMTLYAFFGVLLGAAALARIVRHLMPSTPRRAVWAGGATLALATALPWMLRRPAVYEVAISAGFLFAMAGLYVLVSEALRPGRPRGSRWGLAGAMYGLALLSRPDLVALLPGALLLAILLRCDGRIPRTLTSDRRRVLVCLLGPLLVAGAISMIYNAARFSGPLDFGNKWQMGGRDTRVLPYNDVANIVPALYGYLVAPLRFTLSFPYIHLPPPPSSPIHAKAGFGAEATASVFWAVPFVLLSAAFVLPAVWRRVRTGRPAERDAVLRVVGALLLMAVLPLGLSVYAVPYYTERYELDFLPYAVMAATVAWAALLQRARTARRAGWWRRGGLALAAWSMLIGVAIGFTGYYDSFKRADQGSFRSLERATSSIPTLVVAIAGRPMIADVSASTGYTAPYPSYTTIDVDGGQFVMYLHQRVAVTIMSPGRRDAALQGDIVTNAPGTFTLVATRDDGDRTTTDVTSGLAAALPVHLERGGNYFELSLRLGPQSGKSTTGEPQAVQLEDFRVR
jgi:hypothetical protein